jgi:hypothetical protein
MHARDRSRKLSNVCGGKEEGGAKREQLPGSKVLIAIDQHKNVSAAANAVAETSKFV